MRPRLWLSTLLLLATALPRPLAAGNPVDGGYAELLHERLSGMSINLRPAVTAFDYVGLHRKPDSAVGLRAVRAQLLSAKPSRMTPAERTAWAINVYNFLVIERVMQHFGANGAPPASVRDIPGFFSDPAVEVEGRHYSLDTFERHFLFADVERDNDVPPPAGIDPRIHFALVCAARGCPPLRDTPYRAATLDADLDAAVRNALLSPAHLRAEPRTLTWAISSIFHWYEKDFGGRAGVIAFLKRYAPGEVSGQIQDRGEEALNGFVTWDWRLNQVSDEYRGARARTR